MSNIRFHIPSYETIPTDLRLYVDDVYVTYQRITGGFRFYVCLDDEAKAKEVVKKIIERIKQEHDEPQHGISWRTVSLEVVPQEERYKVDTIIDWVYRVRDSY